MNEENQAWGEAVWVHWGSALVLLIHGFKATCIVAISDGWGLTRKGAKGSTLEMETWILEWEMTTQVQIEPHAMHGIWLILCHTCQMTMELPAAHRPHSHHDVLWRMTCLGVIYYADSHVRAQHIRDVQPSESDNNMWVCMFLGYALPILHLS